jgi:tRNA(fMet)-specific endonuclease VapC
MNKGYLFDSNIAIAILTNEKIVIDFMKQASSEKRPVFFSVVTECEVLAGLRQDEQLLATKMFAGRRCLDIVSGIAQIAGNLRREQKELKGRRLKTPDALILATAKAHDLILVSRDSDMRFAVEVLRIQVVEI